MIVAIEPHNACEYPNLMDKMFRLRARVFRDRLGWDVQVIDGKEPDLKRFRAIRKYPLASHTVFIDRCLPKSARGWRGVRYAMKNWCVGIGLTANRISFQLTGVRLLERSARILVNTPVKSLIWGRLTQPIDVQWEVSNLARDFSQSSSKRVPLGEPFSP